MSSYRVEMVGLSERDRTLLRSLLMARQARTGVRWDGGANHPPIYFIDRDSPAGAEFWQSLTEGDRRDAAIVIASTTQPESVRWLAKPLRSATLLMVLEQMTLSMRATSAAAAPAAASTPAASTRSVTPRVPKPGEPLRLLDILDGAPGTTARTLQSAHWPDLVLGNGNTHAMRTAELEIYAEGFAASLDVAQVSKYSGGPMDDAFRVELDTLRWLALLYAPIGEIAERLPYPKRARLRKPPAFGHLPHKLHHVRMAAALAQHAATPLELAEGAGTDEETVQRFLGACAVVGLLEEIAEPVARAPASPAPRVAPPAAPATAAAPRVAASTPTPSPAPRVGAPAAAPATAPHASAPATSAGVEPAGGGATAATVQETSAPTPAASESGSVLERLRASREQNRARVAAAIRGISND